MTINPKANATTSGMLLAVLTAVAASDADPNWKLAGVVLVGLAMAVVSLFSSPVSGKPK